MPTGQMNRLMDHLRRTALLRGGGDLTDGQLLARFLGRRDGDAFAALVGRHGPMVLGVCRRVLGSLHDAEDAFQATFLVFAKKAGSITTGVSVGGWLYRVAHRTALQARARLARQRARERQVEELPHPAVEAEAGRPDWLPFLDRELSRLPDKYRVPVVLCELEGRPRKDVARQLGIPEGTLSSRLAAARQTLAGRLARHGLALGGASLAAVLGAGAASAAVPAALVTSTTEAATLAAAGQAAAAGFISLKVAALTEGVLKAMFLAKLKTAAVVVCGLTALGLGTGGVLYQTRVVASAPSADGVADSGTGGGDRQAGPASNRLPDSGRRSSQATSDRERDLRQRLDQLKRDLDEMRSSAAGKGKKADWGRGIAEDVMRQVQDELKRSLGGVDLGRGVAEKATRQAQEEVKRAQEEVKRALEQAQREIQQSLSGWGESKPRPPRGKASGSSSAGKRGARDDESGGQDQSRTKVTERYEKRRRDLQKQMESLEKEYAQRRRSLANQLNALERDQQKALANLDRQRTDRQRNKPAPTERGRAKPSSGDRLDQILERLERLESRLNRLERGRGSSSDRK
jgi:RNA polymerase sigma factor (sigma-70 family)